MWVVELHPAVRVWVLEQDSKTQQSFEDAIQLLRTSGPHLGRPLVDSIVGSKIRNLKELRPGSSGRSEVRALFAFDPKREAIVLVAGDKSRDWANWYKQNIPLAEERFEEFLKNDT
jgi:hypothetical protein